MSRLIRRFIALHWQGRLALLPSCLLLGLGLRLGLDALTDLRPPGWPFAATLGVSLVSASVLPWQLVGGARAVARGGHDLLSSIAGGAALLATALLFTVSETDTWSARALPPLDLPAPPRPFPVRDGTIRIEGNIGFAALNRLDAALNAALAAGHKVAMIELESPGGRIPAARGIARRILDRGLATRATGTCASACTLIFAAGRARSLAPGARLGFHGYHIGIYDSAIRSLATEESRDSAFLRARGIAPGFIARAFATPHDEMWFPSASELRAAGWLSDAGQATASP